MPDTGFIFAGTGESAGSGVAWASPDNITADDGTNTTASLTSGGPTSQELYGRNFDLSGIPDDATIDGIEFVIQRSRPTGNIDDGGGADAAGDGVHMTLDGTYGVGTQLGTGDNWDATPTDQTYGGPTELWGQGPLTGADIKTTAFGVKMKARRIAPGGSPVGTVDYVKAKIYYTEAAGGADLVIADAAHSHTADSPTLTQVHVLTVADASHAHASDNLALTQVHSLAVADALHSHAADNLTLVEAVNLAIQDALHAHAADGLTVTQVHVLVVSDAAHGHAADGLSLTQVHILVVADAAHGHAADEVTLSTTSELAISDALHAHSSENAVLTQVHMLVVDGALHAHEADSLLSFLFTVLEIQDALHAHTADVLSREDIRTLPISGVTIAEWTSTPGVSPRSWR